jgi:tetratricopeptide (TPR) repeat protein
MKKRVIAILLLAGVTFVHADKYAPSGNTLADMLQWLAVQTACMGQYNMAETGDFTNPDPDDHYNAPDIREYLATRSRDKTSVDTFYGICFDYARAAYDEISKNASRYARLGVKAGYIAARWANNPRQIRLFDPVDREGQGTISPNGVPIKENACHNVEYHGDPDDNHAWLWVIGNDGTTYWIDPTWTDNNGYVVWGVVRNGREEKMDPAARFCAIHISSGTFAQFSRGDANRNVGNYGQAIDDYNEVIRLEPKYEVAYNNRGRAYYQKGDYDRAIADFTQAIQLDPKYAEAYRNRGLTYYAKGSYDLALADYNQAITLDPQNPLAFNGRAYVHIAKDEYEKALEDVNQAIRLSVGEATWYVTRGQIYLDKKVYGRAITDLETALRISPNFSKAKELLERAKRRGR